MPGAGCWVPGARWPGGRVAGWPGGWVAGWPGGWVAGWMGGAGLVNLIVVDRMYGGSLDRWLLDCVPAEMKLTERVRKVASI